MSLVTNLITGLRHFGGLSWTFSYKMYISNYYNGVEFYLDT